MKIGDKINIELNAYELTSHWDTPFGVIYLYTFKDFFNNVFIWKTPKLIEDDIHHVSGRIKDIIFYNNVKEFELTYCRTR